MNPSSKNNESDTVSRILVVDDEEDVRLLLEYEIRDLGHEVVAVADAWVAISEMEQRHYDIVITDIRMPGMDGIQFTKWIQDKSPETDVIVVTGYSSADTAADALRLGAFDYLTKPFGEIELLSSCVNRAVEKQALKKRLKERTAELERTNAQLQAEIIERKKAEDKIKVSLQDKEMLLKEINHRVKNNLQIMSNLLIIQSQDNQDRIKSMARVHERLNQTDDLARIDFGKYIKGLATDLISSYGLGMRDIELKIEVENILLSADTAIPCGVIVNELVANSLKHAFPGNRSGEITVSFQEADGRYTMTFKDNGVGLPEDLDTNRPSSLGLTMIKALTDQLGGTIDFGRNGGCEVSITFSPLIKPNEIGHAQGPDAER